MKFTSLSYRFVVWFIAVALLPLALFGYLSLLQHEAELRGETLNRMSRLADKKTLQIKAYLTERIQDAQLLARSNLAEVAMSDLSRTYTRYRTDSAEYRGAAKPFEKIFAGYIGESLDTLFYDVFLITPQGEIIFTHKHEPDFATNLINGPYRNSQLARVFRESRMTFESSISSFGHYAPSGAPAAFVAAPIIREGVLLGVVAFQLDIQRIYQVAMDKIGLGVTGETLLAKLINPGQAVFVAPLRHDSQAALQRKIDLNTTVVPMRKALAGHRGSAEGIDYAGEQVVAAWRYLPELHWGVVVKMDAGEAFAPLYQQRKNLLGALLALAVLGGLIAFLLGRRLVVSLKAFAFTAEEIAKGDLSKRVPETRADEIGALARSFNYMTEKLQALYRTLEDRIEERTRDLNVSNEQLQDEINEREHMEKALLESNVLFSTTFDLAAVGIAHVAPDGRWLNVNQKICDIVGYTREELLARTFQDITHPDDLEIDLGYVHKMLAGEIPTYSMEKRYFRKSGEIVWVNLSVALVRHADGSPDYFISVIEDISARKQAEEVLKKHKQVLDAAREGFWMVDMMGNILEANAAYEKISGYTVYELKKMHVSQLEAKEKSVEEVKAHIEKMIAQGSDWFETRHRHKDGHEIDIEVSVVFIREVEQFAGFMRDITERKLAQIELQHNRDLLNEAQRLGQLGSWELDPSSGELRWSDEVYRIFELDPARFSPSYENFLNVIHPDDRGRVNRAYTQSLEDRQAYDIEHRLRMADGRIKWVHEHCSSDFDASGKPLRSVGAVQDVTAQKQAEDEIRNLAFYDALTRLPNRRLLLDRFRLALSASARSRHYGAVLFLDLDRFKTLNDTLGHDHGDVLLIEVAGRIQSCVREVDTVARLGGDEFVLLLEEVDASEKEASQKVALIAEKIRAALTAPYQIKGNEYHSSSSIGVCLYCGNEKSVDTLLKHADLAMYQAKESGRNMVRFFDPLMQQAVEAHAALEMDLRHTLTERQLHLYYQMQVGNENQPLGAEALVRWIHPVRGMVSPAQFIPVAEESSLILEIGYWVLDTACRQLVAWEKNEATRSLSISVNVSAEQFKLGDFVDKVAKAVRAHHIDPSLLKLELTESVVLNNITDVVAKMHALKALGVKLSMDDFGTGYSSLSYFKQLPLDQIKIDQSFVRDIATDPNDAVMVATIIGMAHNFRMNVIAEGVETREQLDFLKQHGCMAYQGYLFSKPVPIGEFEALLGGGN